MIFDPPSFTADDRTSASAPDATNTSGEYGFRFREWDIYKDARAFRVEVNGLLKGCPKEEQYVLVDQAHRALDSIILNIAEGANRNTDRDTRVCINRAHGSLDEVVSCLDCALDSGYITAEQHRSALSKADSLAKRLKGFSGYLAVKDQRLRINNHAAPRRGQLLFELLITIAVAATIVAIGAQLIYVSLRGNRWSGEKNVALGLKDEEFEAVLSWTTQSWTTFYNLTKGTTTYAMFPSGGSWNYSTGTEAVTANTITYTRSFTIQNVCRDTATRSILGVTDGGGATTACTGGGSEDPSTQQVSVAVRWPGADPLTAAEYLTRWRNKACVQSSWASQGSATSSCPATTYASSSNITPGANLQLCTGGC